MKVCALNPDMSKFGAHSHAETGMEGVHGAYPVNQTILCSSHEPGADPGAMRPTRILAPQS